VISVAERQPAAERETWSRQNRVRLFATLVFVAIGLDFSTYVAGLFHLYVHDLTAAIVAVYGVALARENRSVLPTSRLLMAPIGLLIFLLANSVVLGALHYGDVPTEMQKLFWFEHGNALRIVGELLLWIWTLGHLAPSKDESRSILDFALWGCALNVGLVGTYWIVTNTSHVGTMAFDLNVMTGLPLAMVFVMTRARRGDMFRLALFGAGSLLLYSRTAILAVTVTTLAVLLMSRQPRAIARAVACLSIGWLFAFAAPIAISSVTALLAPTTTTATRPSQSPGSTGGQPTAISTTPTVIDRTASFVSPQLAPYTIPSRLAIWSDALRIFEISPIVGVGYHDYFIYSGVTEIKDASAADVPGLFSSLIKQAHNDYLSWLAETGIIGLAAYLSFLAVAMRAAFRLWRELPAERLWRTFTFALLISLAAVSTFGEILIPRTPDWTPSAMLWWIVIGLVFVDSRQREETSRRPNP
jgi:O-antigen ligase